MEGISCESEGCLPKSTAPSYEHEIERVTIVREKKGCLKPTSNDQFRLKDTGECFKRCPVALVRNSSWIYVGIYNSIEGGHLPYSGGALEQPANLMLRMKLVRSFKLQNSKG